MSTGEQLLELTIEYQEAKLARDGSLGADVLSSTRPAGRAPEEIAAEYETVLRKLMS